MELAPSATDEAAETLERRHRLDGTYNLRDTGGYLALTGVTRWGKLFRSDALHRLTEQSRERFAGLGIGLVIDLRDDSELLSSPSRLAGLDLEIVHAPIYPSDGPRLGPGEVTLASLYRVMVTDHGGNLAQAVRHIARSGQHGVLVHCTAGKDRTGLVIALALEAAGVGRADVIADYAATEGNLRGEWAEQMLAQMVEHGYPPSPQLEHIVTASPPELLADILETIDREYGSVADYLLAKGLEPSDLELLRQALVEPTSSVTAPASTPTKESTL